MSRSISRESLDVIIPISCILKVSWAKLQVCIAKTLVVLEYLVQSFMSQDQFLRTTSPNFYGQIILPSLLHGPSLASGVKQP